MSVGHNLPAQVDTAPLLAFELPHAFIHPALAACRGVNTAVDAIFYDTPTLIAELRALDAAMLAQGEKPPSRIVDFDARYNPEGALLLMDATNPPYVHRYTSVDAYLQSPHPETRSVDIATITGVGSSALGSAALAWTVSKALAAPVLAIVPGYGLADMILQALGGWFGFGLHDFLGTATVTQNALANAAPATAAIGRNLSATTPDAQTLHGAPVFRHGSGASDALHALLSARANPFKLLVGHSKGALQIANALRSLSAAKTQGTHVLTLGCPIAPEPSNANFHQYLGLFDALGQLNMWFNLPDYWPPSWHSTNPRFPPAMDAEKFAKEAVLF